jgi:superfamily I DNA and/or RNA helicase
MRNTSFDVGIIDEAGQCTEVNIKEFNEAMLTPYRQKLSYRSD